ncbi:MAG: thioester reductase [Trebouxia sp. A1-2]|nr:MAG: thioester reductase [Trebouxia sp. A1-2]
MHVLVLAKGTRGDVQPAAVLAHALLSRHPQIVLHFVTHLDHKHWLKDVLHPSSTKCLFLDTLPARTWNTQDDSTKKRDRNETVSQLAEAFQSDHDLGKSIAAIHKSFLLAQEITANQEPQRTLIIFNLFSLEALHLAEALGISCLAISPCLLPYTAPNSFPRQFSKAWPALLNALQTSLEGCVSWAEVEHWLWPAFSQRWSTWRRDCLNLTSIPFSTCVSRQKLGKAKPGSASPAANPPDTGTEPGKCPDSRASSCGDQAVAAEDDVNLDHNVQEERHALPHSIPLLYGLSEHVIQRPGYWPASVHCCGFWQQQGPHNAERLTYLGVAVQGSTRDIVGPNPVHSKQATADTVPCPTGQMNAPQTKSHMYAAASGASCSGTDSVTAAVADRLAGQIKTVLGEGLQQQCQDLKARLADEDGVSNAVDMISQHMANAAVPAQDALQNLARQIKLQADSHPDRQVKARLVSEAGATSAQASTAAADEPTDPVTESGTGPVQGTVQLPNGWSVPAQSQVEALFIYREIVEQQCYLQYGIQIRDGDVVMDVGANIGLFSWWVMQGGPDRGVPAVVWGVEPLPANLAVLQTNLEQHGLLDHVRIIPQAVAEAEGEKVFRYYPAMPGNSTCHVQEKEQLQRSIVPDHFFLNSQDRRCPVTTISSLMDKHGICQVDLLKVDVEGCELQALQGIQDHHWLRIRQCCLGKQQGQS